MSAIRPSATTQPRYVGKAEEATFLAVVWQAMRPFSNSPRASLAYLGFKPYASVTMLSEALAHRTRNAAQRRTHMDRAWIIETADHFGHNLAGLGPHHAAMIEAATAAAAAYATDTGKNDERGSAMRVEMFKLYLNGGTVPWVHSELPTIIEAAVSASHFTAAGAAEWFWAAARSLHAHHGPAALGATQQAEVNHWYAALRVGWYIAKQYPDLSVASAYPTPAPTWLCHTTVPEDHWRRQTPANALPWHVVQPH